MYKRVPPIKLANLKTGWSTVGTKLNGSSGIGLPCWQDWDSRSSWIAVKTQLADDERFNIFQYDLITVDKMFLPESIVATARLQESLQLGAWLLLGVEELCKSKINDFDGRTVLGCAVTQCHASCTKWSNVLDLMQTWMLSLSICPSWLAYMARPECKNSDLIWRPFAEITFLIGLVDFISCI